MKKRFLIFNLVILLVTFWVVPALAAYTFSMNYGCDVIQSGSGIYWSGYTSTSRTVDVVNVSLQLYQNGNYVDAKVVDSALDSSYNECYKRSYHNGYIQLRGSHEAHDAIMGMTDSDFGSSSDSLYY